MINGLVNIYIPQYFILDSPNRKVEQVALDTNRDLNRTEKFIETEFDKATRFDEELNHKVNDLANGISNINDRLDMFEVRIKEVLEILKKEN